MKIRNAIVILVLASSLAGCGVADLISQGMAYSRAVETDLEQAIGLKPDVGFNWHNGNLKSVTVTFPRLYAEKPLGELADTLREVVARDFKQAPDTVVLAFALHK